MWTAQSLAFACMVTINRALVSFQVAPSRFNSPCSTSSTGLLVRPFTPLLPCLAGPQPVPGCCSILLSMMTEDSLETDLCQHVVTLLNRALDSPDGPHQGSPQCLPLRHSLVTVLLDKGLMRVISELQDLGQEPIFTVSLGCSCT